MNKLSLNSVVKEDLLEGVSIRNDFPGFQEDYSALYCLIKKTNPKSFIEIGTSVGLGTNIICQAMGMAKRNFWSIFPWVDDKKRVYSLDVPPGTDSMIIYPKREDKHPGQPGKYCKYVYTQLLGDSRDFDYTKYYPLEGWFIDGKHAYGFVRTETIAAFLAKPKLIIWHDMDIPEVRKAVNEVSSEQKKYKLYRIIGTRIAFATNDYC